MEFFGQSVKGLVGSAFLYTNQETISVGLSCSVEALIEGGVSPPDLLARFKQHPSVRCWLRGAERVEYGAQMIPEGGFHPFDTEWVVAHFESVSFFIGTVLIMLMVLVVGPKAAVSDCVRRRGRETRAERSSRSGPTRRSPRS